MLLSGFQGGERTILKQKKVIRLARMAGVPALKCFLLNRPLRDRKSYSVLRRKSKEPLLSLMDSMNKTLLNP